MDDYLFGHFDPKTPSSCWGDAADFFYNNMVAQVWRVNALLVVNAILMGVMVGIGAYGHRYRHRPLTRFIFLGATTLFPPIVSYVVSTTGDQTTIAAPFHSRIRRQDEIVIGRCDTTEHISRVLVWTALVQIVGINTTAIIATDARKGRKIGPPVVLLVQAVWTSHLAVYNAGYQGSLGLNHRVLKDDDARHDGPVGYNNAWSMENVFSPRGLIVLSLFALIFAKLILKCYAWYMARQSLVLGRNPRVIVGYMEQLHDGRHHHEVVGEHAPPLIVMGEDTLLLKKQSHGYSFKNMPEGDRTMINNNGLVTLDKVWQLDDMSWGLTPQLKDVCISLALFKLLRCRFAKYTVVDASFMKVPGFLWDMLLKDSDDERFFGLIEYELSFLHDCYYSSLPISYAKSWLPILSIFISLLSVGCCLVTTIVMFPLVLLNGGGYQLMCLTHCNSPDFETDIRVGNLYYDLVPVCLLVALVVLTEVREITSYVYSNWTKVALICCYVRHVSWLKYPSMKKCVDHVLRHRCKLLRHWDNKMNQCSILVLHPRRTPVAFLQRLIHLPDQNKKVPRAVKTIIVDTLRSYGRSRNHLGVTYLRRSIQLQVGDSLLWTVRNAKGTADTILVCHIATSILEVRSQPQLHQPLSGHKTAAIHLSRYCVYLVAYHPELLPDDDEWCKSLYKEVKKDADRLHSGSVAATTPVQLIKLLSTRSEHEVLKNGAVLGGQLAEMVEGEEMVWKALANFWSELILYVSPSDNMDGHAEAIARGGELITLLWALQAHLGIVSRPDNSDATTDAAAPV